MKVLFKLLALLLLAIILGSLASQDNGYVLIGRGYNTIEMSLALFVFIQVVGFVLLYLLIHLIKNTWSMPDHIRAMHHKSNTRKARRASKLGLIDLAQGHWRKAERTLIKYVKYSDTPLLNYLSAARAAQELQAPERRDHYLAMAHRSMPEADFAVELTQAELQLAHGQYEQALATLVHLHSISPKHTHVLLLLAQIYEKLQSWDELKTLLPRMRKYKILVANELDQLQKRVYIEYLKKIMKANDTPRLAKIWQQLPKPLNRDRDFILLYSSHLLKIKHYDDAEDILRNILKTQWDIHLTYLYGLTRSSRLASQLSFAELLTKQHENNPVLLLTLGRLCIYQELWGKARTYLEASLGAGPLSETYKELGLLMERLKEPEQANHYYRKGLLLAAENFSHKNLPVITK